MLSPVLFCSVVAEGQRKNIVSTAVQHRALHCARYRTDHITLSVSGLTAHSVARPPLPLERPLYYQRALRTVARVKSTRKVLSRARNGAAGASGSYKLSLFNYFDNMVNRLDSPNKKKDRPKARYETCSYMDVIHRSC